MGRAGGARALVGFLLAADLAVGWRTYGVLPLDGHFTTYVGKFCFDFKRGPDEEAGKFEFAIHGRVREGPHAESVQVTDGPPCYGPCETQGNLYLMVFDDEQDHWKQAHDGWRSLTCEQMLEFSSFAIPLPLNGAFNRTVFVHEKIRPRFWYFTFAACGIQVLEPVHYSIHTQNILQGWQMEFGIDERGTVSLHVLSLLLFSALTWGLRNVAINATGAEALRSRPLLRLLFLSSVASAVGAFFLSWRAITYAIYGEGARSFELIGQMFVCLAKAMLTSLQMFTAKGWALFYSPEEIVQRRVMCLTVGAIVFFTMACELHADYKRDWSTDLYLYESWQGLAILLLNVSLFLESWRSMRETYRHESSEEMRLFYAAISAASLLYFLTLPVMCLLSFVFSPWVRAKYVGRAEVASRFIATALLSTCLRPSRLVAMVNSRLEEGLETVGEVGEDPEEVPIMRGVDKFDHDRQFDRRGTSEDGSDGEQDDCGSRGLGDESPKPGAAE